MLNIMILVFALFFIALVLVQQKSAGLGSMAGGGDDTIEKTRRGGEKVLHTLTVISGTIFIILSMYAMVAA